MNRVFIVFAIFIGIAVYLYYYKTENFQEVKMTTVDNEPLKTVRMGLEITYEGNELKELFGNRDKIKISIPINYKLFIHKNDLVTELGQGLHIISKDEVTKIKIVKIRQTTYLIKDYLGNVITVVPNINFIDWDDIYVNYGYDDYWIYYPNNIIRPYYYFNHPRYNPRRYPYVRKRTTTARTVARDVRPRSPRRSRSPRR